MTISVLGNTGGTWRQADKPLPLGEVDKDMNDNHRVVRAIRVQGGLGAQGRGLSEPGWEQASARHW